MRNKSAKDEFIVYHLYVQEITSAPFQIKCEEVKLQTQKHRCNKQINNTPVNQIQLNRAAGHATV